VNARRGRRCPAKWY